MGILFDVTKDGEEYISLTEHSIKTIKFFADTEVALKPKYNDITRDIFISGFINADKINEAARVKVDEWGDPLQDDNGNDVHELREIDSVRQLANWAIVPEYCECYCDASIKITNARGDLVKEESFANLFVVDYQEGYDDDSGAGTFYAHIREREIRPIP